MPAATVTTDAHANPISGTQESIARYDAALDRLLRFHPDVIAQTATLATDEPEFPMGHVLSAYLCLTSTDSHDLGPARAAAENLRDLTTNDRETAHSIAIDCWLGGDWHGASQALDSLLQQWPADLLALMIGHQLDFYLGDAANLRDRVGRSMLAIEPADPHHGFVRGMHAFGLEESGHYDMSEAAGLRALEVNPDDVWALHAVVHSYEMRGMVDDGIRFMRRRQADWADANFFTVHNWWHLCLYLLEAGHTRDALAIYDERIHHAGSDCVPLELLDASALLWRLMLDGEDTGDRFAALASAWEAHVGDAPWYAFNDLHAVMAFCGAGRLDDATAVVERLSAYVDAAPARSASNVAMTAEIGLPACRAALAFAEGRDDDVIAELVPIRAVLSHFGGSHAQRDALQRTVVEAALRSGRSNLARALLSERISLRDTSVYAWQRQSRLLRSSGDATGALAADATATALQARFAQAASEPAAGI